MEDLGQARAVSGDVRHARQAHRFIMAWVRTCRPDGDPINENKFEPLLANHYLLAEFASAEERAEIREWVSGLPGRRVPGPAAATGGSGGIFIDSLHNPGSNERSLAGSGGPRCPVRRCPGATVVARGAGVVPGRSPVQTLAALHCPMPQFQNFTLPSQPDRCPGLSSDGGESCVERPGDPGGRASAWMGGSRWSAMAVSIAAVVAVCLGHSGFGAASAGAADGPDFVRDVKPILELHCVRCHGPGRDQGGLQLHLRDGVVGEAGTHAVVVPGDIQRSELIYRIELPAEHNEMMPQEALPLDASDIEILRQWVEAGAPWPEGLRLQPTRRDATAEAADRLLTGPAPETPEATAAKIDRLVAAENAADGTVVTAELIDDSAFFRRVTIDLIGRIPTLEELEAFEAMPAGTRRREWVRHLLEHPRFNDRWAVFFADMLRVRTGAPGGNQLLAFVHQSLAERVPYDEMARQMIAASGRPNNNPAVGFILGDDADPMELAGITAQVFLGIRLACAECHDHPFDDWSQEEFYQLAAFFGETRRVENNFANTVFVSDDAGMRVQWPPEGGGVTDRQPMEPHFPLVIAAHGNGGDHVERLRQRRAAAEEEADSTDGLLDDLLDRDLGGIDRLVGGGAPDVLAEAERESRALNVEQDLFGRGELRGQLAERITDPRNPYFSRAFVNRVWFELIGRGFVEPIDNFSDYVEVFHPAVMELLAREFVAGEYELRQLVETIVLTDAYARDHGPTDLAYSDRERAERSFAVAPPRRMLAEVLFDSILVAGHLFDRKWEPGANVRTVTRQIRVPIEDDEPAMTGAPQGGAAPAGGDPAMTDGSPMMADAGAAASDAAAGFDLERGIEIDFNAALSGDATADELEAMRMQADQQLAMAQAMSERMQAEAALRPPQRYRLETIEETIDDNPVFTSAMRMATPAPPAHFMRVFGQPSRDGLGEFRDHAPSLRQQLMLLNGRATHEAARVGTLEPLHDMLAGPAADPAAAVRHAYREILTRDPAPFELAEGLEILAAAESPLEGMADLRWALFNCHEFRYLP